MGAMSRREFLRLGTGAAAFAAFSGLGLLTPRDARAVVGIDDAALGGLVLLVATLGGYAFSRSVANVSLDALGYDFSSFVSDANNQAAAVTSAIADANNLGVELNRSNAENAAQSIAAGTGYFAEVMGDAATSGRVALDNFISGAGELPGVLRSLVGNYVGARLGSTSNLLSGCVGANGVVDGSGNTFYYDSITSGNLSANALGTMLDEYELGNSGATWSILANRYRIDSGALAVSYLVYGTSAPKLTPSIDGKLLTIQVVDGSMLSYLNTQTGVTNTANSVAVGSGSNLYKTDIMFSGNLVSGSTLPAVDRPVDVPDVIGPGYDNLPLANDLVIDPSTDEVVSAGSLPLPTSIPDVWGDYVGTLNDILAGVIPGQISLPVSVAEPVVVGTAEGVQSMSITDAIAGDTSLSTALNPPVGPYPPYEPTEPPVDVPEGPWTPAVSLPFEQIWPFNMIYSFVELFEQLGGS